MATSVVFPRVQFFANNGRPLIGGRINTYIAGTSRRAPTYKDAAKAQPNTNPIILDARGEAAIYLAEGVEYKFVVEDAAGALIMSQEPVYGAIWPNAAEWPSNATLAYQYMLDAKAAADSIGAIKFYDTYAQAMGDVANWPTEGLIEIARDETRDGARTRYKPVGASLVFVVNLDQLRIDLATEFGYARGNLGKPYNMVGGALRRDTAVSPDWFIISDSAHLPIRLDDVKLRTVNLQVDYRGGKVGTFIAAPDETLAADGVSVGASVGGNLSVISAGAPCSFTVDLDNANAITFSNRYFDASRFGVSVGATGLITITHPRRQLMQLPIVQHWAAGSYSENLRVHYLTPNGAGQTRFYLLERVRGRVAYVGSSAWGISGSNWSAADCTFSWDAVTGRLTVTHPTTVGNFAPCVSALAGTTPLICSLVSSAASQFVVQINKLDGTVPALTSAVGFFFDRGDVGIKKTPEGLIHVYLGIVKLNMAHVDSASGNIWTLGVHPSI